MKEMCDPILHSFAEEFSWAKVTEDIVSGSALIIVGFVAFQIQESFKISAEEVRRVCRDLNLHLNTYSEMGGALQRFEFQIRINYHVKNTKYFLANFFATSNARNEVSMSNFRIILLPNADIPIPENLLNFVVLLEPIQLLRSAAISANSSRDFLLEILQRYLDSDPAVTQQEVKNSWNDYCAQRDTFFDRLRFLKNLTHNAIHGFYNWNRFVEKLNEISTI